MEEFDFNTNMSTDIKDLKNNKSQLLTCESNKCKKYEIDNDNNKLNNFLYNTKYNEDIKDEKKNIIYKQPKNDNNYSNYNLTTLDNIILIILFILLNTQKLIMLINSSNINYLTSMIIRALIMVFIFYNYKKYIKKLII